MWSNYILTSLRTLGRNKLFVGINLLSIALAFSLCTIAYFNVQFNQDFNTFFDKADKLYKMNSHMLSAQGDKTQSTTPLPLAETITNDFPGIEAVRFHHASSTIKLGDLSFRESIGFIDPNFLDLFDLPTKTGTKATLSNNSEVYITQEVATKYFGKEEPVGQIIEIPLKAGKSLPLTVAGVLSKLPENISFHFDILVPFQNYIDINNLEKNNWSNWIDGTFFYAEDLNKTQIAKAFNTYLDAQNSVNKGQEVSSYQIDSILDWPSYENSLEKSSFMGFLHPASVLGTLSSAIAVLLLASFNFINTSIAISRRRLKEIGMRKVLGGRKRDLKIQFLVESLVQILLALAFSGLITYFLAGAYNSMFEFEIVQFSRVALFPFLMFMITVWLITGLLAGIYPAFYISRFESIEIFRNKVRFSRKNLFTKTLLTFQLMVCVYNVFSLIIFVQNAQYQEELDRGYTVKESINIPLTTSDQFTTLKQKLESNPIVEIVTGTVNPIGFSLKNMTVDYLGSPFDVASLAVGKGYLEHLNVRLSTGDFFGENDAANKRHIIVNRMLADAHTGDLLNGWISNDGIRYDVIGIVDDFNLKPIMLDNKIQPTVIFFAPEESYTYINVVISTGDMIAADASLNTLWNELYPEQLYRGFPQEDVLGAVRETNSIMLNITSFVSLITLMISAMGLYAMVYLNIQSRIKEFGVHKVLGAPVYHILLLINREVALMFALASIAALILGDIVINQILDIVYAYHREMEQSNYIWPVVVVFIIMTLAIGFRSLQTAKENPVEQLRFE